MKKHFSLVVMLFVALGMMAQAHITISDPKNWSSSELQPYVGQTVIFDSPLVICVNTNSSSLIVAPWRHFMPENQGVVGSADYNQAVRANGCSISLNGIPSPSGEPSYRCGEMVYNLKAKVNSTTSLTWVSGDWVGNKRTDLQASLPDLGDYRLLVCGFNLENYFITTGSMGAKTEAARQKQRTKVSKALKQINADLFGLVELQQGDEALTEIVADLNSNIPGRNYQFFSNDKSGTFQKVDFVYDANKLKPIGTPVGSDVEVQNRKKMQCFVEIATGERFIYSINHFKAMNTGGADRRVNESRAVVSLYNSYSKNPNIKDRDVLIMGDLNCYGKADPILVFLKNGMYDLHRAFHADSSYSYMFSNLASYIDHALVNGSMYPQITGMAAYHINSDEDDAYTYDKSNDNTMFRCSDHDPVLVGLKLDSTLLYDPTPQINTYSILTGESDKLVITNAVTSEQASYYAIYDINGRLLERKEIGSEMYEVNLAQAPGVYIVYIYYNGQVYQRRMIVR